jgi:hypothetical protein
MLVINIHRKKDCPMGLFEMYWDGLEEDMRNNGPSHNPMPQGNKGSNDGHLGLEDIMGDKKDFYVVKTQRPSSCDVPFTRVGQQGVT